MKWKFLENTTYQNWNTQKIENRRTTGEIIWIKIYRHTQRYTNLKSIWLNWWILLSISEEIIPGLHKTSSKIEEKKINISQLIYGATIAQITNLIRILPKKCLKEIKLQVKITYEYTQKSSTKINKSSTVIYMMDYIIHN